MNRNKRILLAVVAGTAVAITAGTVAYGSIPGSDNQVTACVTPSTGAVRIVDTDAGQTCQSTETKVSWGGGMRFRGVWSDGVGPGNIPYTSSNPVKKGDVIRYDGPERKFGCTTPKGAWVNVVGQHSYPCLEFPQNWAPLALDGAAGRSGALDTHWVNLNAAGQVVAASRPGVLSYPGTGYAYVTFPGVDLTKCAVTASVGNFSLNLTSTAQAYTAQYALVTTKNASTGTWTSAPMSIVASCAQTS